MSDWKSRQSSADEAIAHIKSGARIFIHGAAATPTALLEALARRSDLEDIKLYHLHTTGPWPFNTNELGDRFFSTSLFTGAPLRGPIEQGHADFMPIFLADIPGLFLNGIVKLDAAFVQLSPPDKHDFCTLGTSVDTAMAAVLSAKSVVAEINEQMPRTLGNSLVPLSRVEKFIASNRPIYEQPPAEAGEATSQIGSIIADLVEDGATLQMGIGAIPDAVLARLANKHDLGVHTEMFSDGVIDLVKNGVINNKKKKVHPGRLVTSFIAGTRRLYDFVDDNPLVDFHPCDVTNDTSLIRKNPKVMAINSALSVDLTGQVCADSVGYKIFSGIGGQMDFIRGAALSEGGKPIIALPSTAAKGKVSRICPALPEGSGVVTTRGHVHWIVTEFGAVNLHGKSLRERGEALVSIAHPDFRAELKRSLADVRHFVF